MKTKMAIVLLALFLSGCSTLKVGYYFADNLIIDRLGNFLSWENSEKTEASADIAELMYWHRTTMLPKYADFFEDKSIIAQSGSFTREQVEEAFTQYRVLVRQTIAGAMPYFAKVLVHHSNKDKLAHLQTQLNEAFADRYADEKAETREISIEEWVDRQSRNLERFVGSLSDEQLALIGEIAPRDAFMGLRWLENRKQRQDAFLVFMEDQPNEAEISEFLTMIMLRPYERVDPEYHAVFEKRWETRADLYFTILNSLDADQKQNLVETLNSYASDMREMASSVGS